MGLGLNVSYMAIADDEGAEYSAAVLISANLTYVFADTFSVEISAGRSQTDIDYDPDPPGDPFQFGELTSYPLLVTGRFHLPITEGSALYFGGGLGYFFNSFDLFQANFISDAELNAEDSTGFHISCGLEWSLSAHMAMELDAKYIWNEPELRASAPEITPFRGDIDLNTFVGGISLKYYF